MNSSNFNFLGILLFCVFAFHALLSAQPCIRPKPQFPQWRVYIKGETGTLIAGDQGGEINLMPMALGFLIVPPNGNFFAQLGLNSQVGLEEHPFIAGPYIQLGKFLNNKLRDHRWYLSVRAQGRIRLRDLFPYNRELISEGRSISTYLMLSYVYPIAPRLRMSWTPFAEIIRVEGGNVAAGVNPGVNVGIAYKLGR
ncbi:MAG: hypothetical protein AAFW00_19915 [Bacteroidota bacterium]